jgi:hypothetical protein
MSVMFAVPPTVNFDNLPAVELNASCLKLGISCLLTLKSNARLNKRADYLRQSTRTFLAVRHATAMFIVLDDWLRSSHWQVLLSACFDHPLHRACVSLLASSLLALYFFIAGWRGKNQSEPKPREILGNHR